MVAIISDNSILLNATNNDTKKYGGYFMNFLGFFFYFITSTIVNYIVVHWREVLDSFLEGR